MDRPLCSCGRARRKNGICNGRATWRSKCSRCESRRVDAAVSADLVEEMHRSKIMSAKLGEAIGENEELRKRNEGLEIELVKERGQHEKSLGDMSGQLSEALGIADKMRALLQSRLSKLRDADAQLEELRLKNEDLSKSAKRADEIIKEKDKTIEILRKMADDAEMEADGLIAKLAMKQEEHNEIIQKQKTKSEELLSTLERERESFTELSQQWSQITQRRLEEANDRHDMHTAKIHRANTENEQMKNELVKTRSNCLIGAAIVSLLNVLFWIMMRLM